MLAGETWNVSSLVGLIGLFGIAVQNSLVLVTQTRGLIAEGRSLPDAVREASIGRVRPKLMTAGTATLGLLPLLVLRLHGTEIERPLAVVMIGGLLTSTLFTLLVLPTFYLQVHGWLDRRSRSQMEPRPECRTTASTMRVSSTDCMRRRLRAGRRSWSRGVLRQLSQAHIRCSDSLEATAKMHKHAGSPASSNSNAADTD